MKIAILGTRGIPNHYGGFEQFAEYLSHGLAQRGHEVTVYNSHTHPYKGKEWNGVKIIHCYDPEDRWGTKGQFIYDFNCILDTRRRNYDIILQLGYTSNSIWNWLLPKKRSVISTNMDGLEWRRTKYSRPVQRFLRFAEKLAVRSSDFLVSDSIGIQQYLFAKYQVESVYIPYGANLFSRPDLSIINKYLMFPYRYNMLVARLEPENSIEVILDGVVESEQFTPFLVVGNHRTRYGHYLKSKYKKHRFIRFLGGIYDINKLNNLRYFSNLYFHGHTVGGTNPSLLEAMASQALICAHHNVFNQSILGDDGFYFETSEQVSRLLQDEAKPVHRSMIEANTRKIETIYSWPVIIGQYIAHFEDALKKKEIEYDYLPARAGKI
jgi:glycosyltransferase involved in cell wall biosynthesis